MAGNPVGRLLRSNGAWGWLPNRPAHVPERPAREALFSDSALAVELVPAAVPLGLEAGPLLAVFLPFPRSRCFLRNTPRGRGPRRTDCTSTRRHWTNRIQAVQSCFSAMFIVACRLCAAGAVHLNDLNESVLPSKVSRLRIHFNFDRYGVCVLACLRPF